MKDYRTDFGNLGPAGGRGSVNQRSDNRPAQARAVREACRTPNCAGGRGGACNGRNERAGRFGIDSQPEA
jgi:hypothetical protein